MRGRSRAERTRDETQRLHAETCNVASVAPARAGDAETITITGSGFEQATGVEVNGDDVEADDGAWSLVNEGPGVTRNSKITVLLPTVSLTGYGALADVTVLHPNGDSTKADAFTYDDPA